MNYSIQFIHVIVITISEYFRRRLHWFPGANCIKITLQVSGLNLLTFSCNNIISTCMYMYHTKSKCQYRIHWSRLLSSAACRNVKVPRLRTLTNGHRVFWVDLPSFWCLRCHAWLCSADSSKLFKSFRQLHGQGNLKYLKMCFIIVI